MIWSTRAQGVPVPRCTKPMYTAPLKKGGYGASVGRGGGGGVQSGPGTGMGWDEGAGGGSGKGQARGRRGQGLTCSGLVGDPKGRSLRLTASLESPRLLSRDDRDERRHIFSTNES